jgi:hypothetical protein
MECPHVVLVLQIVVHQVVTLLVGFYTGLAQALETNDI